MFAVFVSCCPTIHSLLHVCAVLFCFGLIPYSVFVFCWSGALSRYRTLQQRVLGPSLSHPLYSISLMGATSCGPWAHRFPAHSPQECCPGERLAVLQHQLSVGMVPCHPQPALRELTARPSNAASHLIVPSPGWCFVQDVSLWMKQQVNTCQPPELFLCDFLSPPLTAVQVSLQGAGWLLGDHGCLLLITVSQMTATIQGT